MVNRNQRKQIMPPSSSKVEIHSKMEGIVYRHEQIKIAYLQLRAQIDTGLSEAGEVFASLAIPLMKLVGLKTAEMAEDGRFANIVINKDFTHGSSRNGQVLESQDGGDRNDHTGEVEEESYATRATVLGNELRERQQTRIVELVHLLKQIETRVNSSEDAILRGLDNHTVALHSFFQKAIYHLAALHSQNEDTFFVALKLLRVIFNNVNSVLGSVKNGVEDLVQNLSEQMCKPMVEYVKSLKEDMRKGTSTMRLVTMVEEMERIIRDGRLEVEHACKKARMAEEGKADALLKLKATKETIGKMKEHLKSLSESKIALTKPASSRKEAVAKDDKLLWEMLNEKRKYQALESPEVPKVPQRFHSNNNTAGSRTLNCSRPVTRSYARKSSPQTPCLNTYGPMGSSTSMSIRPGVSRRRITP